MDRGINLGGALDRRDGLPGWQVRPEHLDAIASAGFSGVRLSVRWAGARADVLLGPVSERSTCGCSARRG
jgi:hypothetical protein